MGAEGILASASGLAWIGGIALLAGFAHGLSGFGFPVISTPMVALFTDVRTAVMVTLFPNIVVNVLSAVSGAGWREVLVRWDTEVTVCNMFNPFSYGVLRQPGVERDVPSRFRRLWHGPNARLFRSMINTDTTHPYCRDCYFLYQ